METELLYSLPDLSLYSLSEVEKQDFFVKKLKKLFQIHIQESEEFRRMMVAINYLPEKVNRIEDFPYIPVRLFKMFDLLSVPRELVVKTMTSSGTTGQSVSKIFLDRQTSTLQSRILGKIVSSFLGSSRAPMIIIDCEDTIKNRNQFSARSAGITGFSLFASKRIFALNNDMSLNLDGIVQFLEENAHRTVFLFGFTFIVYQHFYKELINISDKIDLSNAVLIHGGGWKKLLDEAVDSETFKQQLKDVCSISRVHDYYGMVEQTGTIHVECEKGYLHTSEYSDIVIRNPKDFSACGFGEEGIIQVLSLLPVSYPGQSLLTEDMGVINGEDSCECGRKGKFFKIKGRLKNAEIRGCSDTYEDKFR